MAKTNEHVLCEQFAKEHLSEINRKFDQCATELMIQFQACPTTLLPLKTTLDENLKEFVQLQQKYIENKMKFQLARYQDMIQEKELFETFSTHTLTNDQVKSLNYNKIFLLLVCFTLLLILIEKCHRSTYDFTKCTITIL